MLAFDKGIQVKNFVNTSSQNLKFQQHSIKLVGTQQDEEAWTEWDVLWLYNCFTLISVTLRILSAKFIYTLYPLHIVLVLAVLIL